MPRNNTDRNVFDSVALKFLLGGLLPSFWKKPTSTPAGNATLGNSLLVNATATGHTTRRRLVVHGLERTGTGFCTELIRRNLENILIDDSHKHEYFDEGRQTGRFPWYYVGSSLIKYIICVRHPYSWFLSYKSHHLKRCTGRIPGMTMLTHHPHQYDLHHYITTFNSLYSNWISKCSKLYDYAIVRYEDILERPKESMIQLCLSLDLDTKDSFTEVKEYINNYSGYEPLPDGSFSREDYYLKREYMNDLSPENKATINKLIDKDLISTLGYSLDI